MGYPVPAGRADEQIGLEAVIQTLAANVVATDGCNLTMQRIFNKKRTFVRLHILKFLIRLLVKYNAEQFKGLFIQTLH